MTLPQELCPALHFVCAQHLCVVITSHQGCEIWQHCGFHFCPWCCIRIGHFLLCTPTQPHFTCNGTNNYDKYNFKRLYHDLFDFWKKLTKIKAILIEWNLLCFIIVLILYEFYSPCLQSNLVIEVKNGETKDNIPFSPSCLVWSILSIFLSVHSCSTTLVAVEQEFSLPLGLQSALPCTSGFPLYMDSSSSF